jgi:hypothetical protein
MGAVVPAERYVEIITNPPRQRYMPALPELLRRAGEIGLPEVDRQAQAEQIVVRE